MATVDVLARVKADTSGFTSGIKDAEKALNRLSTSSVAKGTIIGNVLFQAAQKAATGFGRLLVGAFQDSIRSAQEAQAVQNRLATLLRNTGGATEYQIGLLHQQARALEASTVVSADNVAVVQSQLATFDLHSSSIAQLTPAILDYVIAEKGASASADTFRSYTNGLAQALNGQFGSLTKVGFVLDDQTKRMIKSGTENERAAAIVKVLNSTYKGFATTAGTTAAGAQMQLSKAINQVKQDFGTALLPVIQQTQGFIANKFVPILRSLQERFGNAQTIEKFINFLKDLGSEIVDFASGIGTLLAPIFKGVLIPVLKTAIATIIGLVKALGAVGRFIQSNAKAFQVIVGVIVMAVAAYYGYRLQVMAFNAAYKVHIFLTRLGAKTTATMTKAQKALNVAMYLNPIGLIIAGVVALTAGFVYLWNNSESFRKMIISIGKIGLQAFADLLRAVGPFAESIIKIISGPMRLLLRTLASLTGNETLKKMSNLADSMTDNIGEWAIKSADKIEGFKDKLDSLADKKIKAPSFMDIKAPGMPNLDEFGLATGGARVDEKELRKQQKIQDALNKARKEVRRGVGEYNDYLVNDFAVSMMRGSDSAKDAVLSTLDKVRGIFDSQAKTLSGPALKSLEKAFDKVNTKVRKKINEYASVSGQIQEVEKELDYAYGKLEDAIQERQRATSRFQEVLSRPFGEPSELDKAMGATTATVDSLISGYNTIREAIIQRATGFDVSKRDTLLSLLETQTDDLIKLSKRRALAVATLEKVEEELQNVLQEQAQFSTDIRNSVKSFASALADLSDSDAKQAERVIKTSTGLVITQMKESRNGIDRITDQLKARLKMVVTFSANIQALLAKGLDQEYIKQLLEAGPQAAGETAQVLASASATQIAELNSLYTQINAQSTKFGKDMAGVFYNNAVAMNKAFVTGAKSEVESITTEMTNIKNSIEISLKPLATMGTSLGEDLAQGLYDAISAKKDSLVSLAQKIASEISAALASSLAEIGVAGAGTLQAPSTKTTDLKAKTEELRNKTEELREKIEGKKVTTPPTSAPGGMGAVSRGEYATSSSTTGSTTGGINANVTINTEKVSQTVNANTIAKAISHVSLYRRFE